MTAKLAVCIARFEMQLTFSCFHLISLFTSVVVFTIFLFAFTLLLAFLVPMVAYRIENIEEMMHNTRKILLLREGCGMTDTQ